MRHGKLIVCLMAVLCFAQDRPAFEVASVKLNQGGPETGFSWDMPPGGSVTVRNMDVWNLIRTAYGLRELQMSAAPGWLHDRRFDIQARPSQGRLVVSRAQTLGMVQALLEDRFQLKWHRETREAAAYGLTVGSSGSRLHAAQEGQGRMKFGDLDVPGMGLDQLCQILESDLDRPVVNRTGLAGSFAIQLKWASTRSPVSNVQDLSLPSLFTAVQEQLGLKLEAIRAPVEIFVIDSVAMPAEN